MPTSPEPMPANVLQALQRGNTVEAIKLLRQTTGLGLKEAKDVIDAYLSGTPMRLEVTSSTTQLPASAVEALQRGDKIEAIKRLREQTGLGLKEAKDIVDASPHASISKGDALSPGEVPKSGNAFRWLMALAIIAVLGYYLFRRFT